MIHQLAKKQHRDQVLPAGVELSDLTKLLNQAENVVGVDTRWRWRLLEIVQDAMRLMGSSDNDPEAYVWHQEARQRTTSFVRLALSRSPFPGMHGGGIDCWQITPIEKLAGIYRVLEKSGPHRLIESETLLRGMTINVVAIYSPAMYAVKLNFELRPFRLYPDARRALILATGLLVQTLLYRARFHGFELDLRLVLKNTEGGKLSLLFVTNHVPSDILESGEYDMATKLCGRAGAELIWHSSEQSGGVIEFSFERQLAGCCTEFVTNSGADAEDRPSAMIYAAAPNIGGNRAIR